MTPRERVRAGRRPQLSLRARLTWVFSLAMVAMLTGLGLFIYLRLGAELSHGVDRNLGARADALTAALGPDPRAPLGGGHRFVDPDEAFAQVLDRSGRIFDSTPGAMSRPLLSPAQAATLTGPTYLTREHRQRDDADRLLAVPVTAGGRDVIAVVGETLGDRRDALAHLLTLYAVTGPAGLLLASTAGWVLAGAALRPVERMSVRAAQLSHVDPTGRLPVPATGDELAALATTLNDLLARLHAAVAREHRFVDDASHELRTPLAVMKAELDLAATRPRSTDELMMTLRHTTRETDRLVTLAEDLLVLARARQGGLPPRRVPTLLSAVVADAVRSVQVDTGHPRIRIDHTGPDLVVDVDPDQTRRAIANLVENAVRHGGGDVTVTTSAARGSLRVDVSDHGAGFPSALLATAFEPFVHGHAPARPGTGLGLAIVQAIAAAHRGGVTATNPAGGGALVRLHLGPGLAAGQRGRRARSPHERSTARATSR